MRRTSEKRLLAPVTFSVVMMLLVLPGRAWADSLDFTLSPSTTGSVSYAGGATPLVGTNIPVTAVEDLATLKTFNVIGGLLDWTSGNFTGSTLVPPTWTFGSNSTAGSITITGCVDVNKDGDVTCDAQDVSGTLMTGTVSSATVLGSATVFKISLVSFNDTKNAALLSAFGITGPNQWNGSLNLSFNATGTPPNKFKSTSTLSGDAVNNQLPEPATLSLLGLSLLGAGWAGRKRHAKRQ